MLNAPNIVTRIKVKNTLFEIYAYRKLSKSECIFAIKYYLQQKHLNKIPKKQKIKIITIIGSVD